MPHHYSRVLDEMTVYLVENFMDIHLLMPSLITEKVLCHMTKAYVVAPPTNDQRVLRLLEILSTRQDGMFKLVKVLNSSGSEFLASALIGKYKFVY